MLSDIFSLDSLFTYLILGTTILISIRCFSNRDLMMKLSFSPYYIWRNKEWSRFITHGFVHADTIHLFVNMFTFWSFGSYIESLFGYMGYGKFAFLGLYFGGMIIASLYDLFKYKDVSYYHSIGASGAVSAVLFCSIFFHPWEKILLFAIIPIPGILFGFVYLWYCQYMAKQSRDNINHNAHFYGALFGFFYPLFWEPRLIFSFINQFLSVFN